MGERGYIYTKIVSALLTASFTGKVSIMNLTIRVLLVLLLLAAGARAADPRNGPVDTTFLKQFAETRGFLLGRPVRPKPTPDGKACCSCGPAARPRS